jgi:hypothetical protein
VLGLIKNKPVAEYEASGAIERVYHEIKQSMRVTGVNLNFRTWAALGHFLPLIWDVLRPSVETIAFESSADQLRADAAHVAERLGPLNIATEVALGESQFYQIRAALDLYHYVNPKLLLFTSATSLLLQGKTIGRNLPSSPDLVDVGVPAQMYAMEMEAEEPDDHHLKELYIDIQETLSLRSVNSDYRTLAMWPDYLAAAWERLKPLAHKPVYRQAVDALQKTSRALANELPFELSLDQQAVEDTGADIEQVIEVTKSFEQLLPGLIINVAMLQSDWRHGSELSASPFPVASRRNELRGPQ